MSATAALKMDHIYRFQRHVYDATRAYYLFGRDRMIAELDADRGQPAVLEIACGTGRNLIKAARQYPNTQLFGFDISQQMLQSARSAIKKNSFASRVTLASGDATNFDGGQLFGVNRFDRIFISYALSMIPDWRACVLNAVRHLAPGGRLLIVDFGTFDSYPAQFRQAQHAWLKCFSVEPIAALEHELSAIAAGHSLDYHGRQLYRGYSVIATLARQDERLT